MSFLTSLLSHAQTSNKGDEPSSFLHSHDLNGIAKYIMSDECSKIAILAGAGISVSAGIPDFGNNGGFDNTSKQKLGSEQNSQYISTIGLFRKNPAGYIEARRDMILAASIYSPTLSHWFLRLLSDKGYLHRFYSTNIDGLDTQIGIGDETIVSVHGTLAKAHCISCNKFADMNKFRSLVYQRAYPILCHQCSDDNDNNNKKSCKGFIKPSIDCKAFVKPNTTKFGKSLPQKYYKLKKQKDLKNVDLFIVIGTPLVVAPSKFLPTMVDTKTCARLLLNRDAISGKYEFEQECSNDIWYKGNCDDGFRELAKLCGWYKDLYDLLPPNIQEKERSLMENECQNITDTDDKKNYEKEEFVVGDYVLVNSEPEDTKLPQKNMQSGKIIHISADNMVIEENDEIYAYSLDKVAVELINLNQKRKVEEIERFGVGAEVEVNSEPEDTEFPEKHTQSGKIIFISADNIGIEGNDEIYEYRLDKVAVKLANLNQKRNEKEEFVVGDYVQINSEPEDTKFPEKHTQSGKVIYHLADTIGIEENDEIYEYHLAKVSVKVININQKRNEIDKFGVGDEVEINSDPQDIDSPRVHIKKGTIIARNGSKIVIEIGDKKYDYSLDKISIKLLENKTNTSTTDDD